MTTSSRYKGLQDLVVERWLVCSLVLADPPPGCQVITDWQKKLCSVDKDMIAKDLGHEAGFLISRLAKEA